MAKRLTLKVLGIMKVNLVKVLSEKVIAFFVVLLITVVYLHPIFLGKTDTPIDIRDLSMYPWRYYAVDEKIKRTNLWKYNFSRKETVIDKETNEPVFDIKLQPHSTSKIVYPLQVAKEHVNDPIIYAKAKYILEFDFMLVSKDFKDLTLEVSVLNNSNKKSVPLQKVLLTTLDSSVTRELPWYAAQFYLNDIVKDFKSIGGLDFYNLQFVAGNNSKDFNSIYLRNLKVVCDDSSDVPMVKNPYTSDLIQWFTSAREYYSNSLKRRKLPFWTNNTLTGVEFLSEPQLPFLHPFYFLTYVIFDHFTAHSIIIFSSFLLCGLGAFILARFWNFSFEASLLTAIVYMFHPFNATWFSFEHMLVTSAHLPFLLLAYEKNLTEPRLINKYLIASATILGLTFISGHLQNIYYALIFFFLFVVFKLVIVGFINKKHLIKHIFSILFVFVFGLMIGLIVLLPFFSVLKDSHRVAWTLNFIKSISFPFKALLGIITPYYNGLPGWSFEKFGWGFFRYYMYFGLLPFLFFLFSFKKLFKDNLVSFFFLTIIISFLISMGTPLFFLLKDCLPGFKQLQHHRFLEVYSFCVPFLSGIGFQIFIERFSFRRKNLKNFFVFFVLLLTTLDLMFHSSYFLTWSDKESYKPIHKRGVLEFLISKKKELREPFRVFPMYKSELGEIKLNFDVATPNTLLPYGLEETSGSSSFVPRDLYALFVYVHTKDTSKLYTKELLRFFPNANVPYPIFNFESKIIDLLNVKYFIVPSFFSLKSDKLKKVFSGDCTVYENLKSFPRAFLVPKYKIIESPKDTIVELDSERFNAKEEVILMTHPHVIARSRTAMQSLKCHSHENGNPVIAAGCKSLDSRFRGNDISLKYEVNFLKYEGENIILDVETNKPGFLILGHNLNNNWKVKINGKEDKHLQANLIQRAVYLPKAGDYKVEFYYFPKLFLIGLGISCFALFVLLFLSVCSMFYKKV